jgi:hypothetical protein
MVGAGLPQIAELAGDAKSYSERLFKFPRIGNLNSQDARAALAEPAREEGADYSDEALDLAIDVTGGYPYFLQELGYAVWGVADGPTISRADIDLAVPTYEAKLDESFFRVPLDRATDMERIYLRAMAELGPEAQKAQDVAAVIGRKSTQMGPTRAQLNSSFLRSGPRSHARRPEPLWQGIHATLSCASRRHRHPCSRWQAPSAPAAGMATVCARGSGLGTTAQIHRSRR